MCEYELIDINVDKTDLELDTFDLLIIYEYVPALHNDDGWYADWDDKEKIVVIEGAGGTGNENG